MITSNPTQEFDERFEAWIADEIENEAITDEEIEAWSLWATVPEGEEGE